MPQMNTFATEKCALLSDRMIRATTAWSRAST